jgi:hypothetical protein
MLAGGRCQTHEYVIDGEKKALAGEKSDDIMK